MSDPLSERGLEILRAAGHEVSYRPGLKGAELAEALRDAEALVVRSGTRVTAQLIAAAPSLRVVGRAGVGVDNIDVDAARARGIEVLTAARREHRDGRRAHASRSCSRWRAASRGRTRPCSSGRWDRGAFQGVELSGKVIGIVGLGRIGLAVAKRAAALDMEVIGFDPTSDGDGDAFERTSYEDLLGRSDVLTYHVPLTPSTRGLLDAERLRSASPGALVVNTSRGASWTRWRCSRRWRAVVSRGRRSMSSSRSLPPGARSSGTQGDRHSAHRRRDTRGAGEGLDAHRGESGCGPRWRQVESRHAR